MNLLRAITLCAGFMFATAANASVLFIANFETLTAADPTQLGRLSRDTIISDWSGPKAFPGVFGPTNTYHYRTYVIPVGFAPFIQISIDDPFAAIFASAYLDTYNPANLETNYLGDEGSSGNFFGVDPAFFQVVVPATHNLVVVINDPSPTGGGLGVPYSLMVEGFADTNFNDPVPEPGTMLLSAVSLGIVAMAWRRRSRRI